MNNYPHSYIWINGRKVLLKDIENASAVAFSDFEKNTFNFIRQWVSEEEKFLLQTSGSTGTPKEITVTRSQMIASAKLTETALQLHSSYNALVCLDTKYIAGKMMLVRSFYTGMKIFAVDPCANPLVKIPVDQTIHFAALVPYQVKSILESKHPHLLDTLMTCIIGGALLDKNIKEKLKPFTTRIFTTYGMTETISHIALQSINDNETHYQTLPGIFVRADERDCLVIHAPYLIDDIVTNDIVEVINENRFRWIGRWDNIINSGGVKISPENIEARIGKIFTRLQINAPYFIHHTHDEALGQRIVLVMQSPLPDELTLKTFIQALPNTLTSFEQPTAFYETSYFIYTETQKINRVETFKRAQPLPEVGI